MSDDWYYSSSGTDHQGPVTLEQLRGLVREGKLAASHLVWREGMPQWVAAGGLQQLFPFEPPPQTVEALGPIDYQSNTPQINYYNPMGAVVVFAGFWWRFLAYIIDMAILWVPSYVIQTVLRDAVRMPIPMRHGIPMFPPLASIAGLATTAMEWLYFALMESSAHQATLGKMVCGLIVTDAYGRRITFGRATGRYYSKIISALILYVGFMMAGWTERKQALHDMIASTQVIKKNLPQA